MNAGLGPVLITGGTSGIGFAIANALLHSGRPVAIIGRDPEKCVTATKLLADTGADLDSLLLAFPVDTTDLSSLRHVVDQVVERWGRLDGLVTSAGRLARGSVLELDSNEFFRAWETNVVGTWKATKAALPAMLHQRYGRIVTIGSILGSVGAPERGGYAATKGAVASLTRSLALEVSNDGITANCIAPGPVKSPLNTDPIDDLTAKSEKLTDTRPLSDSATQQFNSGIPLGRWGAPSEIAHIALSLLSLNAGWTTGSIIHIDGGYTAQ